MLVSPHRTKRPWQGQTESTARDRRPAHDPTCYLCPGNRRAQADVNPPYQGTFVFDNDFSALLPDTPVQPGLPAPSDQPDVDDPSGLPSGLPGPGDVWPAAAVATPIADPLLQIEPVRGTCRVICFSPRHDLTLAEMEVADIAGVVDTWAHETDELGRQYRWVQVFENKGAVMGCSNPHPHGQIWATSSLPNEALAEDQQQAAYLAQHGSPLLVDYAQRERALGSRLVHETKHFVAVVPFWAIWPFETLIVPRTPVARLPDLTMPARNELAEFLRALLGAYDRLFDVSFPYSMGWHGAPFDREPWRSNWRFAVATPGRFTPTFTALCVPRRSRSSGRHDLCGNPRE